MYNHKLMRTTENTKRYYNVDTYIWFGGTIPFTNVFS